MHATTVASQDTFSVTVLRPVTSPVTTVVPRIIWPETALRESRDPVMTASATGVAGQATCLVTALIMKAAVAASVTGKL